jgi:hypothetical protein
MVSDFATEINVKAIQTVEIPSIYMKNPLSVRMTVSATEEEYAINRNNVKILKIKLICL